MTSDQFFRCEATGDGWRLEVAKVVWEGHTPDLEWSTFRQWNTRPSKRELVEARDAALGDPRYFRTCTRCHKRNNTGHMHDDQTCQSCAERHLGVVY